MTDLVRQRAAIAALFFVVGGTPAAHAESDGTSPTAVESMDLDDLLGVVEGPTRYNAPLADSQSTVTVISAEEMERSGAWTIADLLRFVPGVDVSLATSDNYMLAVRGLNEISSNNVIVLVDGFRVTNDFDGEAHLSSLPLAIADIERIEVVRGPSSVVHGANAYTGVINIVRKRPRDADGARFSASVGQGGTARMTARYAKSTANHAYSLSANGRQTTANLPDELSRSRQAALDTFFWWRPSEGHELRFSVGATFGELGLVTKLFPAPHAANMSTVISGAQYSYRGLGFGKRSELRARLRTHYFLSEPHNAPRLTSALSRIRYSSHELDSGLQFSLWGWDETTVGATVGLSSANSPAIADGEAEVPFYAAYLQQEVELFDVLVVSGGLRFDYNPFVADGKISYRAGLLYSPGANHRIRATIGSAFRHPTFVEAMGELRDPDSGLIHILGAGTRDLGPPRITSVEVGYRARVFTGSHIDVALFRAEVDDLIVQEHTSIPSVFRNEGSLVAMGLETQLSYRLESYVSAFGGYTLQQVRDVVRDEIVETAPTHKVFLGVGSSWPTGLSYEARFQYVSASAYSAISGVPPELITATVDDRFILNAHVRYTISDTGFAVSLSGRHLLDDGRVEAPFANAGTVSRQLLATVSYEE